MYILPAITIAAATLLARTLVPVLYKVVAQLAALSMRAAEHYMVQANSNIKAHHPMVEANVILTREISSAAMRELSLQVTMKDSGESVTLPPHYDRKAVSQFLEITA